MNEGTFSAAVDAAQDAFWAAVVRHYPQVRSGDLDPETQSEFDALCTHVVAEWLAQNANPQV